MSTDSIPPLVRSSQDAVECHTHAQHGQIASPASASSLPVPGAFPSSVSHMSSSDSLSSQSLYGFPPNSAVRTPRPPPPPLPAAPSIPPLTPPNPPTPPLPNARVSFIRRIFNFFGYGAGARNKARKQLVSFIWTMTLDGLQLVAIIVFLSLASNTTSPTAAPLNEWDACGKPLCAWNAIWTVRTAVDCYLAYYHWSQQRKRRLAPTIVDHEGESNGGERAVGSSPNSRRSPGERHRSEEDRRERERDEQRPSRAYPAWYSRLSALSTMFTIVWFVMAHIFLYTSTDTCRFSSPYIWWLTFAILSVMYIAVAEVVMIALIVFVIGPIVALVFTVILLLMGRHPLQNPHYIKPDVGSISRSLVDRIPLVYYIPPPPDEPSSGPITIPHEALIYPPKGVPVTARFKKPRFRWLRPKKKSAANANKGGGGGGADAEKGADVWAEERLARARVWEDNWEKSEFPFVRLEENRATCAICLLDFEEPKRIGGKAAPEDVSAEDVCAPEGVVEVAAAAPASGGGAGELVLADASEGVQPLRLLACGHVFHKTCLDPWLTDVSGRCPTCQRPVEIPPEPETRKRRGRRNRQRAEP